MPFCLFNLILCYSYFMNSLNNIWINLFESVPVKFALELSEDEGLNVRAYYRWIEAHYPTASKISRAFSAQESSIKYPPPRKGMRSIADRVEYVKMVSRPVELTSTIWDKPKDAFPRLPVAVQEFLNGDCTIWSGYKRQKTHLVIPPFLFQENNQPLTLGRLSEINHLVNSIKCSLSPEAEALTSPRCALWGVVTILPIPLTTQVEKNFVERKGIVEARGYEVPHALDLILALFISRRYSANPEDPYHAARVQGQWEQQMTLCADRIESGQVIVGPLNEATLHVRNGVASNQKKWLGIVGCKFFS